MGGPRRQNSTCGSIRQLRLRATASLNLLTLCCLPWNPAEQSVVSLSTELESEPESFNQHGGVYWAEGKRESKGLYFPQNIFPSSYFGSGLLSTLPPMSFLFP